jgi:hypothetical protein
MVNRHNVIDKAINVENIMCALITHKYFPGPGLNLKFHHEVLYDPYATIGFKISLLKKCYDELSERTINRLRRLFNIRNIFAHCGLHFTSLVDPDKSGVLDPKDRNTMLDFVSLESEFIEHEKAVLDVLMDLARKVRLPFLDENPDRQVTA